MNDQKKSKYLATVSVHVKSYADLIAVKSDDFLRQVTPVRLLMIHKAVWGKHMFYVNTDCPVSWKNEQESRESNEKYLHRIVAIANERSITCPMGYR